MTYPVYQVPAGDVLPIFFSTYAGATGASITLTGLAVTDIEIYKDGGTTQRASDAGYTLLDTDGIDFDAITGIHGFSIDTGDNTDASFYTVGAWFHVVVSAVTVDAQTVNFIAAAFRIVPAESSAGVPKVDLSHWLGTAAATPTVAGVPEVDVTHVAGATTNVAALATNAEAIKAKTDNLPSDPADQSLIIAATDAVMARLGAPAGASISADIATRASQASVDDVPTNAELATALGTADDAVLAAIDALPTATENADALLNRDMSAVSDTNARSPLNALRFIRNKWDVAAGVLTVKKEDDSTTAWTASVSTDAGAEPVIGNDPA
jgi:hypothetical protein